MNNLVALSSFSLAWIGRIDGPWINTAFLAFLSNANGDEIQSASVSFKILFEETSSFLTCDSFKKKYSFSFPS